MEAISESITGRPVLVPATVFGQPATFPSFRGTVVPPPLANVEAGVLFIRFEDETHFWFPAERVVEWARTAALAEEASWPKPAVPVAQLLATTVLSTLRRLGGRGTALKARSLALLHCRISNSRLLTRRLRRNSA